MAGGSILGNGGRPPPCLLWFVAKLNESEKNEIGVSIKIKHHVRIKQVNNNIKLSYQDVSALPLGFEAPLSQSLSCCLMPSPTYSRGFDCQVLMIVILS